MPKLVAHRRAYHSPLIVDFAGPYYSVETALAQDPLSNESCMACYDAKSADYQRCSQIPAEDRAARSDCFKKSDRDFASCLSAAGCPGAKTAANALKAAALIGGVGYLLSKMI